MYETPQLVPVGEVEEIVLGVISPGDDSETDQRLPGEGIVLGLDE